MKHPERLVLSRAVIVPEHRPHALVLRPVVEWAVVLWWLVVFALDHAAWPFAVLATIGAGIVGNAWRWWR